MKKILMVLGIIAICIGGYAIYGLLTPTEATTKTESQQSLQWKNGEWERTTVDYPASLSISNTDETSFNFILQVTSEDSSTEISGKAEITSDKAVWKDSESACSLNFKLENKIVSIEQAAACQQLIDHTLFFNGEFKTASKKAQVSKHKELTSEEAKHIVKDLLNEIQNTFEKSSNNKLTSDYDESTDYTPLLPTLKAFTTAAFRDGYLKERAGIFYCQCDEPALPYTNLDARFTLDKQDATHFTASSVAFYDFVGETGSHVQYDVVKEGDQWVIDDIQTTSYEEKPLDLTKEEILIQFDYVDKDIQEAAYNGRKVYILHPANEDYYIGVYADSSEVFDLPNELLPKEAQAVAPVKQKPETKPETKPQAQSQQKPVALTSEQAEDLVRLYLQLPADTNLSIVHDHDNESGNFVIHVYETVDPGTDHAHEATYGWYRVDRVTQEVVDNILDFQP